MKSIEPHVIKRVAVIGAAGAIGASWTTYFLSRGLHVCAYDPAPDAEARMHAFIERTWPLVGQAAMIPRDQVVFTSDLEEAVREVDFVQECGPEDENLKIELMAEIDRFTKPGTIIATSTSSLLRSRIVKSCTHPERCIVAHPFNPPHLIPLVEIVGANDAVVDRAARFFSAIGKKPVVLNREIIGHIANRLTAALWREAVNLVELGVGSVEDIDAAVVNGPGLRWSILGPHLGYHLGGGSGGMAHYLEHLGESQVRRWADLGNPTLNSELKTKLVAGVMEEVHGASIAELEGARDKRIVAVLKTLAEREEKDPGRGL